MPIPPPNLILLKYWSSAGLALGFPFVFQAQLLNLLLCQSLHVGWQRDAVVCQLWDLCGFVNKVAKTFPNQERLYVPALLSQVKYCAGMFSLNSKRVKERFLMTPS